MTPLPRLIAIAVFIALALASLSGDSLAKSAALPKPVSPEEAAQLLAKPPAGFEIVDIRSHLEIADYALPGSIGLEPEAALADESLQSGDGPILLVDKDGTKAFAVAGVLSQRSSRQVLVLKGGITAWWEAKEKGLAVKETPLGNAPAPAFAPEQEKAPASSPAPGAPAPAPQAPQPPASKSAGC
ncbi:MAG: rhodanese-like domain-containing protein [Desulfovibrio sp.]|nr:rhodanese-like domain-containing protein [Desulfovibrio sp.]MBI4959207.1 rhodanese-like domain-containing protein [Desulfovibrio sp.]